MRHCSLQGWEGGLGLRQTRLTPGSRTAWKINISLVTYVVEDDEMATRPKGFDEWKDNCTHSCKVLSVGQGRFGGRPATCQYASSSSIRLFIINRISKEVFPKNTSPPTTFTKTKILPGDICIGAHTRTSTSFLRSSSAWEEVAAVVPVDGDVHHLRGGGKKTVVDEACG